MTPQPIPHRHGGRRTLAASLVAALLMTLLALAGPSTPSAAADAVGLTWKISTNAFTSSSLSPAHATTAPATKTADGFSFPETSAVTYDPASQAATVAFPGGLELGNTAQGNYRIRLTDPILTLDGDGTGELTFLVSYALTPAPETPHSWSTPVRAVVANLTIPDGTLTDTGSHVSFTVTPDFEPVPDDTNGRRQFPQAFLDVLDSSLRNHFRQSGSGSDANKAPAPLTVGFAYGVKPVGLTWKMSVGAFTSSSLSPAHATTAPATKTADGFSFPETSAVAYDAETREAEVAYPGAYELGNTAQGNYRIRLADPILTLDGDGTGELTFLVSYALTPAPETPHSWSTPVRAVVANLTLPAGAPAQVGSNVQFVVTPDFEPVPDDTNGRRQFPQAFLDVLDSSLRNHFRQSGSGSDANKAPAPLSVSFNHSPGSQTIDFDPLSDRVVGDASFTLNATASSGLPVSFSATGAACSLDGDEITIVAVGTCTVTATQAGNGNWDPAEPVVRAFAVRTDQEDFVRRAYQVILDRSADQAGLQYWLGRLDGGLSRQAFADALATSPEARQRIVDLSYRAVLGRSADASGRAFWAGRLARGLTPERLLADLLVSSEAIEKRADDDPEKWTELLFEVYLGRSSDEGGFAFWAPLVANVGSQSQLHSLAMRFGRTGEATSFGTRSAIQRACSDTSATPEQRTTVSNRWVASGHDPLLTAGTALVTICAERAMS